MLFSVERSFVSAVIGYPVCFGFAVDAFSYAFTQVSFAATCKHRKAYASNDLVSSWGFGESLNAAFALRSYCVTDIDVFNPGYNFLASAL